MDTKLTPPWLRQENNLLNPEVTQRLFINQDNIPNLPTEAPQVYLARFLEWVEPLVSKVKFVKAQAAVQDYLNSKACAQIETIIAERAQNTHSSWLANWWVQYAYLTSTGPVSPEVNAPYYLELPTVGWSQAELAAALSAQLWHIYQQVQKRQLTSFSVKDKLFSLDTLQSIFASCQIHRADGDVYFVNDQPANFIVVIKNNVFYKLVIDNSGSLEQLQAQLQLSFVQILDNELSHPPHWNLLTATTTKAESQSLLDQLWAQNPEMLLDIYNSAFIVNLDNVELTTPLQLLRNSTWTPNFNRWHAKGIQLVITKNAQLVILADHTSFDGSSVATLANIFVSKLQKVNTEGASALTPTMLSFPTVDQDKQKYFKQLSKNFKDYVYNAVMFELKWDWFTKPLIKAKGIKNSEAFIHLCYQIAQYQTNKKLQNTYVAVDMRQYFRGRTECLRPLSKQSVAFVKRYCKDPKGTLKQFRKYYPAIESLHFEKTRLAQKGSGVNRHLLGAYLAWNEHQDTIAKPALFETKAWKTIAANPLSTSSIVDKYLRNFSFDPVEPNGIGIAYAIDDTNFRAILSVYQHNLQYLKDWMKHFEQIVKTILKTLK